MRFKRTDLPGILIAAAGPVLMTWLFFSSYGVWHHHGTPLLGFMAVSFAVGGGLIAAFTRFVRRWDAPVALMVLLLLIVLAVNWAQRSGNDGTVVATALKLAGVADFAALNLIVLYEIVTNGLLPILDRRDARLYGRIEGAGQ